MLAVEAGLRDQNLGYKIKLAQREHALRAAIGLIFWTFDPLTSRNAHFNINKLGAILRRYERNYYGQGVSTGFDAEVPTDRVIAEWWVASRRVKGVLEGETPKPDQVSGEIQIPDDIDSIRARSASEHLEWRMRVREQFEAQFADGAVAAGFSRDAGSRTSRYLLTSAATSDLGLPTEDIPRSRKDAKDRKRAKTLETREASGESRRPVNPDPSTFDLEASALNLQPRTL
jgi:predicted GNAT superfamily acetyltransferase